MSIVEQDVLKLLTALPAGASGPVTAARKRRNGLIYALVAFAAFLPSAFDWAPGWQAAGLGLLLPGAGFLAWGGAWALLVPVTLGLFWLSCVACSGPASWLRRLRCGWEPLRSPADLQVQ